MINYNFRKSVILEFNHENSWPLLHKRGQDLPLYLSRSSSAYNYATFGTRRPVSLLFKEGCCCCFYQRRRPTLVSSAAPLPESSGDNCHNVVKDHHHKKQHTVPTGAEEEEEEHRRAIRVVLRLTPYGMTDLVHCHSQNHPFTHWSGHAIMRFVHPDHVQRLCAGLCEASKTGMAISIPDIPCCINPSILSYSTTTTCSSLQQQEQEPSYDTLIHLTVHEAHTVYICVLYHYPQRDNMLSSPSSDNGTNNSSNNQQEQQRHQPVHSRLAHEAMVASYVLLQMVMHYSHYLVPVKLLLHNVLVMFLRKKKNR
ncbi:hypothetical protein BDB00DRAFT_507026 [Zychaea mexicana]|uniref:uncharacterized protein n=1 Tax=Zychaea mexicana TaxID=64656 RepID=UPI0022FEEBC2|nr:uncharacterized protein BDB00DRAFT_507026 [Zychaea mexicana]KAI9491252.1 hypothetical protein BDB00DRAFT_507026 [Zychaea mexicana]